MSNGNFSTGDNVRIVVEGILNVGGEIIVDPASESIWNLEVADTKGAVTTVSGKISSVTIDHIRADFAKILGDLNAGSAVEVTFEDSSRGFVLVQNDGKFADSTGVSRDIHTFDYSKWLKVRVL